MTPERWRQVEELYHAALILEPSQQSAFLQEACAADEDLRREVESLVADELPKFICARKGVKLTYDARSLSEVFRQMKLDEWGDADPGAVSIEPLEVSRWRGDRDAVSYGFSMVVVG
jgi:hypothetical protein